MAGDSELEPTAAQKELASEARHQAIDREMASGSNGFGSAGLIAGEYGVPFTFRDETIWRQLAQQQKPEGSTE